MGARGRLQARKGCMMRGCTWSRKVFLQLRMVAGALAVATLPALVGQAGDDREATNSMWPQILNLNVGESAVVPTARGERRVTVLGVEHGYQPDLWCEDNPSHKIISSARVRVDVAGEEATLIARPYQMPVVVNGVRLYVETTKSWANVAGYDQLREVKTDVRLSALDADSHWGPEGFVFPIRNYRWRSATYNNTWLSLVPYNLLYYHHGEDFGAIPDRLDVVAIMDGTITRSPLPKGDGQSNGLIMEGKDCAWRFAHMNTEMIEPFALPGASVRAGQKVGRTGCTWSGSRSQYHDPHVHIGLTRQRTSISAYPFLVEAYLNTYPDSAIAVAGGYAYTLPGHAVELDATRSVPRPGRRITATRWKLHDGTMVESAHASVVFDKPGLYSEELIVTADDGYEARDFLQLRVFNAARAEDMPRLREEMVTGWVYHAPVRGIRPGDRVLFHNRLENSRPAVQVDFSDGTPLQIVDKEIEHVFARPGIYSVTFITTGPGGEPAVIKMPVVVENAK
jgi:hypothetical protein